MSQQANICLSTALILTAFLLILFGNDLTYIKTAILSVSFTPIAYTINYYERKGLEEELFGLALSYIITFIVLVLFYNIIDPIASFIAVMVYFLEKRIIEFIFNNAKKEGYSVKRPIFIFGIALLIALIFSLGIILVF